MKLVKLILTVIIFMAVVTSCKKDKEAPKNETIDRENAIIIKEVCNKRFFRTDSSDNISTLSFSTNIKADSLIWNLGAEEFKNPKSIIRTEFIGNNNFSVTLRIKKKQADGSILRDTFTKQFYVRQYDLNNRKDIIPNMFGKYFGYYEDEPNHKITIEIGFKYGIGDSSVFLTPCLQEPYPDFRTPYFRNIPKNGISTDSMFCYGMSILSNDRGFNCLNYSIDGSTSDRTKKFKDGVVCQGFNMLLWKVYHTNQFIMTIDYYFDNFNSRIVGSRTFKGIKIK